MLSRLLMLFMCMIYLHFDGTMVVLFTIFCKWRDPVLTQNEATDKTMPINSLLSINGGKLELSATLHLQG